MNAPHNYENLLRDLPETTTSMEIARPLMRCHCAPRGWRGVGIAFDAPEPWSPR
ncbi:MAG: hypothetical protein J6386_21055 [Candidatus Synoicihabitans palmerolidicus]|nr:hypothetical protein [Candidatus Synoicihabitans palmerolidicus]